MKNVIVVIGAGQIGQAIARRVGIGKHVLLADMHLDNAKCVIFVPVTSQRGTCLWRV